MTKKGHQQQHKSKSEKEIVEKKDEIAAQDDEEEVNAGFANYLRSSTGLKLHPCRKKEVMIINGFLFT